MDIYIDRVFYPVRVLGPGNRVGIWMAGCSIRCKGCMTPQLWERQPEQRWSTDKLRKVLEALPPEVDKATISGGEPFDQPEALYELLRLLRAEGFKDLWVYSGYKLERLAFEFQEVLQLIDVLIDGPYREDRPTDLIWRGSENQRLHLLSERAMRIHRKWQDYRVSKRELQAVPVEGGVMVIGIPKAGVWKW